MADERPVGITILAVLSFITGIFVIIAGIAAIQTIESALAFFGGVEGGKEFALAVGGGIILFGIISMAVAWGLWTGKKWAWWIEVIFSALSVLSILALNIVGAVIGAVILWYFFKPHVKKYFDVSVNIST